MNKSIVTTFVWAKILASMGSAWAFSTYVLFLTGLGLNLFQVNLLNLIYMTVSTLLDPFTGNWGDRFGQKKIYMVGLFFWGLGMMLYGTAGVFWVCAAAETLAAIGHASMSEALESWLRNHCDEATTHTAIAKAGYWGRLATIPTALLGGLVGSLWGLLWPWILAGVTCGVALGLVWWQLRKLPERPEAEKATGEELHLWTIAKTAWRDPILRRTFVAVAILFACFQPFNMFWAPVFKEASGSTEWLGSLWMGIALTSALGSWLAKDWKTNSKGLGLVIASIGLPMLLTLFSGNWVVLLLVPFLLHEIGRSMWLPVLFSYTNRRISAKTRTSVNSLRSSAGSLGAAAGLLVSGVMTQWLTPTTIWGISAVILLLVALWVYRWNHD